MGCMTIMSLCILTHIFTSTRGHAKMTTKLLFLCNFNVRHSICTTILYRKLFTKSKNIYLFSFYSTKCSARFNFQNAKSLDFSVLRWQGYIVTMAGVCCTGKNVEKMFGENEKIFSSVQCMKKYSIQRFLFLTLLYIFYDKVKSRGSIEIP